MLFNTFNLIVYRSEIERPEKETHDDLLHELGTHDRGVAHVVLYVSGK